MVFKRTASREALLTNLAEKLLLRFNFLAASGGVGFVVVRVEVVDGRELCVAELTQDEARKQLQHKHNNSWNMTPSSSILQHRIEVRTKGTKWEFFKKKKKNLTE